MSSFDRLPQHIRARLGALSVENPEKYAEQVIPALDNQTIEEALKQDKGERLVVQYLARLEEILGTSREY